jgi:hypothetical protein
VVTLVRLSSTGQVSGLIPTAARNSCYDLAFDPVNQIIWVAGSIPYNNSFQDGFEAILIGTGVSVFTYIPCCGNLSSVGGIAWDGTSKILIGGTNKYFQATSTQLVTGLVVLPSSDGGLLHFPPSGRSWYVRVGSADPLGLTDTEYREVNASAQDRASIAVDLQLQQSGIRGGRCIGCEAWQDPATGEWLGVFAQRAGTTQLSTIRMSLPIGQSCGPEFTKGPSVVQTRMYSSASPASGLSWLIASFGPGSLVDPLFALGCSIHLNPSASIVIGPFFGAGSVSCITSVPVATTLQEVPLWYQWANFSLAGQVLLSEARSSVVKQF